MITVAELPEYSRCADKLLSFDERRDVANYLAEHPSAGDLIEGTGGIRKLRWGWTRKEWWGAGDLPLPQRSDTALSDHLVWQERAKQFEQGGAQRTGRSGGNSARHLDGEIDHGNGIQQHQAGIE